MITRTLALRILATIGCTIFAASAVLADADHHMHIQSENAVEIWDAMCNAMPDDCDDETSEPIHKTTGSDAVRVLDEAGLDKGVILSLAYFYGVPELTGSRYDDHRLVRSENAYVAEQISRFPDRLVGFFSINPLADYAIDEIRYWAQHGGLAGLKLHLANSDLDLQKPEHVARLRDVFDVINEFELPVVLHLRNRNPEFGYADAELFIDQVARHVPKVTIQLAHIAGWGGYDLQTDGAIQAFLDAIDDGVLDRSGIWFDIAAVVDVPMSDQIYAEISARFRDIGLDRILFATDWDEVDPKSYMSELREYLLLSDEEWRQLMSNEAPYLKGSTL